jgi:uncharacterized membrane protein
MRFVTNIDGKNIYINKELKPTENIEESIEFKEEFINLHLNRIKFEDKYLACLEEKLFFTDDKNNDAILFISEWGHGYNFYISMGNNYLCFDDVNFTCKNFFDVDHYRGNIDFLKLKTNINYSQEY